MVLVLDDLPDVSRVTASALSWLKMKAYQGRRLIHTVQFLMGFVFLYFSLVVSVWIAVNPEWITVANVIFVATLLVASLTSFMSVKRKIWLRIAPNQD